MSARRVAVAGPLVVAAVVACTRGKAPEGGRLEAKWTRGDTGQLVAPASAEWCAAGRYVAIKATRGDTGLAVAVFPADTSRALLPGRYPLRDTSADTSRPAAAVALRWADPNAVSGFRSDSGMVVLRRDPDGRLAGEVKASGRLIGGLPRRLEVAGTFRDLAVAPSRPGCPMLLVPPPPRQPPQRDSGVDFPHGDSILDQLRRSTNLFPQGLRPQRGGGRPPQRGLPQRSGRGAPRQ